MTEERTTGGTCVNRGCLPSKNLIEAAKIIHDARHPRYPGLSPAEVKLNFRELIAQKDDMIQCYNKHWRLRLAVCLPGCQIRAKFAISASKNCAKVNIVDNGNGNTITSTD